MSVEDRKFLEEAMKQYTFNDADKLKETCTFIKDHLSGAKPLSDEALLDNLDLLHELIELHPRNNLNLCVCGGMDSIIKLILEHPRP
mmetsp:Transcript_18080/g.13122  ORF Transcript_18080/g.13122 Transcript_18080/m.13122 type:complete len:87 (+) Transcript_18080:110-370(+)